MSDAVTQTDILDEQNDEIVAIETELGTSPSGAFSTVVARFDALPRGAVPGGYAQATADQGGITAEFGLTNTGVTFTAVAGRRYKVTAQAEPRSTVASDVVWLNLSDTDAAVNVKTSKVTLGGIGVAATLPLSWVSTASMSGAQSYQLTMQRASGSGTITNGAAAANPTFIVVEDVGLL